MLVRQRRTKLVRFRVSPEEYEEISRYCAASGARSLSDVARSAVDQVVLQKGAGPQGRLMETLRAIQRDLHTLDEKLDRISERLEAWEQSRARGTAGPA